VDELGEQRGGKGYHADQREKCQVNPGKGAVSYSNLESVSASTILTFSFSVPQVFGNPPGEGAEGPVPRTPT